MTASFITLSLLLATLALLRAGLREGALAREQVRSLETAEVITMVNILPFDTSRRWTVLNLLHFR